MVSLPSDILREVLAYCDRFDLNELTQTTRQLNQVIQTYFKEKPFIPIKSLSKNVNARDNAAVLCIDDRTSKYFPKYVWHEIESGLGEKFFRVRRIVLFFNNGFDIDKIMISKLEKISAVATNSDITIIFDHRSVLSSHPKTLSPLTDLLNILTPKCERLQFDLICKPPIDYSFPLLQYPALLHYNEIGFTNAFAKYLNKDDVIEFLHQKAGNYQMIDNALLRYNNIEFTETFAKYLNKDDVIELLHQKAGNHQMIYNALLHYNDIEFIKKFAKYLKKADVIEFLHQKPENQRTNPIRLRIMFPEAEWAEHLIQKIARRFEQATEISPPFQLQFCSSTSVSMKFGPFLRKNLKTGEILRYTISNDEKLFDTLLHTLERAPEFK